VVVFDEGFISAALYKCTYVSFSMNHQTSRKIMEEGGTIYVGYVTVTSSKRTGVQKTTTDRKTVRNTTHTGTVKEKSAYQSTANSHTLRVENVDANQQ
jgi:hypothetical protein